MLTVGDRFPTFNLKACVSAEQSDNAFIDISNESDSGTWKVFFFYPKDFTFICPTELVEFDQAFPEFDSANVKLYGVSTDTEHVHRAWRSSREDIGGLRYPLISDIRKDLSMALGILNRDEAVCHRATFIVNPEGIIMHVSCNHHDVGRNPQEILRTVQGFQTGDLCACNWQKGDNHVTAA
ncbi:MAG: peroxiredoxin [Alphaproteobacteria bacterium]